MARKSFRIEYAFSVLYKLLGITTHQVILITSENIDDGIKELGIPDNPTTRYIVAKNISESEITYKSHKNNLSCKILESLGTLVPISPTILEPYWN